MNHRYKIFLLILLCLTSCALPDVSKRGEKVFKDADTVTPDPEIAGLIPRLGPLEEIPSWPASDFFSEIGPINNLFPGDYTVLRRIPLRPSNDNWIDKSHNAFMRFFKLGGRKSYVKSPIVFDSTLVMADYLGVISALDIDNNYSPKWEFSPLPYLKKKIKSFNQMSLSYGEDMVFAATNAGDIFAIDAKTAKLIWHQEKNFVIRSPLKYNNGILYGISPLGYFFMLDAQNGQEIIKTSSMENRQVTMDQPSILIGNKSAIAAFPNGSLIAFDLTSGKTKWIHDLSNASIGGDNGNGGMSDIDFIPAFFNGMILSGSISGALHLIREDDGAILWIKDISIASQIVVSEEFAFLIDNSDNLIAIHWPSGRIKWATKLTAFKESIVPKYLNDGSKKKLTPVLKKGPLIMNNKIAVFTSLGELMLFSAEDGSMEEALSIPYDITNPIIVNGKIYTISKSENRLIVM